MKRRLSIPTLQQRQHLSDLEEAARPAMDKEEGYGTLDITLLMQEVHVNRTETVDRDLGLKLRQ